MIIVDTNIKSKLMKRYAELIEEYHVTKHINITHIMERDHKMRKILDDAYKEKGSVLDDVQYLKTIHRVINRTIVKLRDNDAKELYLSEKEKNIIIKVKKDESHRPKKSTTTCKAELNAIADIILNVHAEFGEEEFNTAPKRQILYKMLREKYKLIHKKDLTLTNCEIARKISRMHLFRTNRRVNARVREYVSKYYNKGVRLLYIDDIIIALNLKNDAGIIRDAITKEEFPDLKIIRMKEIELKGRLLKMIKTDDFKKISEELMMELKLSVGNITYSKTCYVIAANYIKCFKKRYSSKEEEDRAKYLLRSRLLDRRRSNKYLKEMKQNYGVDILLWR